VKRKTEELQRNFEKEENLLLNNLKIEK